MKKTTVLSLFLLLFLVKFANVVAQNKKPLYKFPFGLQAYTYRNSFPEGVAATLDTIKSLGITELEGGNPQGMTTTEFKALCDERDIKIVGTGGDYQ